MGRLSRHLPRMDHRKQANPSPKRRSPGTSTPAARAKAAGSAGKPTGARSGQHSNIAPASSDAAPASERIAKRLARAGLCSRREAEAWIGLGRVSVNGRVLDSPALVVTAADTILVDGKPIPAAEPPRLWRYHKPAGLVTSARDEKGRQTVFDALPADIPRVVSVGRLDLTSEGLLLLTNDGELSRFLELPTTGWVRRYRVRAHGRVTEDRLANLANGITVDGVRYGPISAEIERQQGANVWLTMGLREGKNREIRRVMEHLGLSVNRLIRTSYGPFHLGALAVGGVDEVKPKVLREQVSGFFGDKPKPPRRPAKSTS